MNVRKIRQLGKDILTHHKRFNMCYWFTKIKTKDAAKWANHSLTDLPPCGTAACFAGHWAIRYREVDPGKLTQTDSMIHGNVEDSDGFYTSLSELCQNDLDLPNTYLFIHNDWPRRLRECQAKAGTLAYAEHFTHTVLEDYIATNGWEGYTPASWWNAYKQSG